MSELSPAVPELPTRVLVVDDDPTFVRVLGDALGARLRGVSIDTTTSGEDALQRLSKQRYDVVVSDCLMPGVHGLTLIEQVREKQPHAVSMLMTGVAERDLTLRAIRAGAYDFIQKPVDPDYLAASVRRAIETVRLRREVERQHAALVHHAEDLEQAVQERTRELSEAHRTKDAFLATVSHELLTPLTAILGWARLLKGEILDEATQEQAVDSIVRNARAQAQLIDDLLDVSRIMTGKLRIETRDVDVSALADEAVSSVLPAATARRIVVSVTSGSDVPRVAADPDRLRQVLWNLLSNAVKFTPEGGHVSIAIERLNGAVEVRVQDDGAGIEAEFLPFVFDHLRQGAAAAELRSARRGLGLGLAIAKHIVELHGGTIDVESAGPGRGALFRVRLLEKREVEPASGARKRPGPWQEESSERLRLRGIRVLLVDDEPDVREVIAMTLRSAGATVATAASGAEALDEFRATTPDVVVCDIGLPDEDGHAVLAKLRAITSSVPAVALTAYARPEDAARAKDAGFQLHLAKPGPPDLPALIARLVEMSRLAA